MAIPGPLSDLQELSSNLCKVSLLGASGQEEESPDLQLLSLLRLREQVKQQHLELQSVVVTKEEAAPETLSLERLFEIKKELVKEIEDVKMSYKNKTTVLQRMQAVNALYCKIAEGDSDSRLIKEKLKHILSLTTLILKSQQEKRDLEQKIYDIRKKRLELKELGASKMLEFQTMKTTWKADAEEMESKKMKRLEKILKEEIDSTTVIQNVFQNIILASHVDWAKDPRLREMVLKLETHANSF
ncbi:hypothetical protein GDO86_002355 [Hymenochirus boettgeri]|uniref:Centromere protein H C-terminal domain-containing protein n=1 Tax=Hymenochirus boettgeri TaxID=247094 RepID=A0A8T2KM78_9PIPI|nr:hypothetical protein GDO86_002355 [Hymenochirus boettgeri]